MYPFLTVSILSSEEWALTIPLAVLQGDDEDTGKKSEKRQRLVFQKVSWDKKIMQVLWSSADVSWWVSERLSKWVSEEGAVRWFSYLAHIIQHWWVWLTKGNKSDPWKLQLRQLCHEEIGCKFLALRVIKHELVNCNLVCEMRTGISAKPLSHLRSKKACI